jgi:hypothetical protein
MGIHLQLLVIFINLNNSKYMTRIKFSLHKISFLLIVFTIGIAGCSKPSEEPVIEPVAVPTVTSIKSLNTEISELEGVISGSFSLPYEGGNGLDFPAGQPIASTGLTGYTITLRSGKLATSTGGSLNFEFKGNIIATGIATFDISFGGQTAKVRITITLPAKVATLSCNTAIFSAIPKANTLFKGTVSIPYTGGNSGGYFSGAELLSTGVTGLTATIKTGVEGVDFISNSGNIIYDIAGTPSGSGTATFPISFGGQSCTISTAVNP